MNDYAQIPDPGGSAHRSSENDQPVVADSDPSPVKYCIVTPVRDEETYISKTVESVLAQTIRPDEWIIVDDGSTDNTGRIIDEYARQHSWIKAVHRPNTNIRSTGGGIKGFLFGYEALHTTDWKFLVNLDGDLSFAPNYFEQCFKYFSQDPKLGIAGGTIYNKVGDELLLENVAKFHVRGATKIYRKECWESIGGMLPASAGTPTTK
jgi:glycosyltransferase involved in cell wall biosynthesis